MLRKSVKLEIESILEEYSVFINMDDIDEITTSINIVIENCKDNQDIKNLRKIIIDILERFIKDKLNNGDFSFLLTIWNEIPEYGKLENFINKLKQFRISFEQELYYRMLTEIPDLYNECERIIMDLKLKQINISSAEIKELLNTYCLLNNKSLDLESKNTDDFYFHKFDDSNNLDQEFISRIRKIPLLTADMEYKLLELSQNGDVEAKKKLIESNLRLVLSRVNYFDKFELPFMDLMQEGTLGLIKAIDNYDLEIKSRLSTYATFYIDKFCKEAVYKGSNAIKKDYYQRKKIKTFTEANQKLSLEIGREATFNETAEYLALTESQKKSISFLLSQYLISLDETISDNEDMTLEDLLKDTKYEIPEEKAIKNSMLVEIKQELKKLSARERYVICLRFGLIDEICYSFREIAKIMNLSHTGVGKIEKRALMKLKNSKMEDIYNAYYRY